MAFTCQNLVDKAEILFDDTGNDDLSADNWFSFLKSAQRQAVIIKPDISVTTAAVVLVEGTKQSLPTGAIMLIDIIRNMGAAGTTPGTPIFPVDKDIINVVNPAWHTDTGAATVKFYVYDKKNPLVFYVSPPQPAAAFGYVEMAYSVTPADPAGIGSAITLGDIYETILIDLMLYYAYSINADQSQFAWERSKVHWNNAVMALGRKDLKEEMDSPRAKDEIQNKPV